VGEGEEGVWLTQGIEYLSRGAYARNLKRFYSGESELGYHMNYGG